MSMLSALRRAVRAALPGEPGAGDALPGAFLYQAIVAEARRPDWYLAGEVPDTLDGRFDMVALVLSLVLLRLEAESDSGGDSGGASGGAPQLSADLAERFIADMDGALRQDGVGDQVVGKHIGRMMAALGGRLGAYRDTRHDDAGFAAALRRNLWRSAPVDDAAVAWVVAEARRITARLAATPMAALGAGALDAAA